jgi:VanZ family protein
MRGGTGRLPGRDNEWDPGLYTFLLYLSPDVFMEAGRFFVPGRYYVYFHINTSSRLAGTILC